ncbi:glycosyl hydrolase family 18 protein [Motilimonas eburnea]|uniref:glycosyl hydrolase family 18 protein n=1 Tax=Motilimonas eburnea TaxID=1737488 RepID=UPI001E37A3AD|nr:glycosyl hydrolase family 18 protein [Motilimonas eburnea]
MMAIQITYFPMWQRQLNWHKPAHSKLANVPSYISHIILSFVSPQLSFDGDLDAKVSDVFFEGESQQLQDDSGSGSGGATLKQLKACLALTHGQQVLVSVGGEIGGEFDDSEFDNIALLVAELGLDGIDIDYEPAGLMTATPAQIKRYQEIIIGFRLALDKQTQRTSKSYLLSCAPTAVGLLGGEDAYSKMGITEPALTRFDASQLGQVAELCSDIISQLTGLIDGPEREQECAIGELGQTSTYRQPGLCHVGTVASAYDFPSTGKMVDVLLSENPDKASQDRYPCIGNMLDLVIYQAYNMGTANVLARILCYEAHRCVSDYLAGLSDEATGFAIGHGCHVGKEAWPQFAYTPKRLAYLYGYIAQFGRPQDGASFWSYSSPCSDDSNYVPDYSEPKEKWFSQTSDVFLHTAKVLGLVGSQDVEQHRGEQHAELT